jgi:hypothetical protein
MNLNYYTHNAKCRPSLASSCYLFHISVLYVLCRVRPNTRDEVKDKTCEDVPVITPTSALLISNRQIQAARVVLESPSRLTNPYQACFCELCPLLLDFVDDLWTMCTSSLACELCALCYRHVCDLCGLHVCWSFVKLSPILGIYEYAMYLNCISVWTSVEDMGKNPGLSVAPARVAQQPNRNTVNGYRATHIGVTSLLSHPRRRDKDSAGRLDVSGFHGWAEVAQQGHAYHAGVTL